MLYLTIERFFILFFTLQTRKLLICNFHEPFYFVSIVNYVLLMKIKSQEIKQRQRSNIPNLQNLILKKVERIHVRVSCTIKILSPDVNCSFFAFFDGFFSCTNSFFISSVVEPVFIWIWPFSR